MVRIRKETPKMSKAMPGFSSAPTGLLIKIGTPIAPEMPWEGLWANWLKKRIADLSAELISLRAQLRSETAAEMERLYLSGLTLQAIGQQFGLTRERVRQLLEYSEAAHGEATRRRREKRQRFCKLCGKPRSPNSQRWCRACYYTQPRRRKWDWDLVLAGVREGETQTQVARRLGIPLCTVNRIVKETPHA